MESGNIRFPRSQQPTEFEGKGVRPFGRYAAHHAEEKLRLQYRTEQDPDNNPDLDAEPDKWRKGGINSEEDITVGTQGLPGTGFERHGTPFGGRKTKS